MITDKETHHYCKDCKMFYLPAAPDNVNPFRCARFGKTAYRFQVICDAEKKRRLQAGEVPAHKLPWYMVYIENTSLSRKPG